MSTPQIPPRPSRSPKPVAETNDAMSNVPKIPPRPARRTDRSISPARAEYNRSPLNEPPPSNGRIYGQYGPILSSEDLPNPTHRPSSAFHPSTVGEEGVEYASFDAQAQRNDLNSPNQTRNVAADLPMHAPKASVPQSTARSRIQTVTRTDSSQAAAAGVGNTNTGAHQLKTESSFSRSSVSLNRPTSAQDGDDDQGIPSMGLQVPMLKYAGDVQAPSPVPGQSDLASGASSPRNHHRKRSSRHEFGPPGSYGLHGHGLNSFHGITEPMDKFDQDWYAKHPEEYKKEKGRVYDPGHPSHDWALSSDDLNRLVHQSSSRGLGEDTPESIGTPSEQIGYLASEEYASRMNSPRPTSVAHKRVSSGAQPTIASPLRKASVQAGQENENFTQLKDDQALESEAEDIIHIDAPDHRLSKVGGGGYDPPTEDFGPRGGNTEEEGGWVIENGYGTPILASDEVAKNKNPSAEFLQPAVSPEQERRGADYYAGWDSEAPGPYQTGRRSSNGKSSRPTSAVYGEPLSVSHTRESISGVGTPLQEIDEYEPLFPDDDKEPPKNKAIDQLKRPDLARHYFPSQDVWEDTPESLQYQTTVEVPQEPEDLTASTTFEHPSKEKARKDGPVSTDNADFLTEEAQKMAKPHFKPGVMDEIRPGLQQRFPSRDIWEDTPDSLQYQTTVDTPQMPEDLEGSTGSLPPAPSQEKPLPKFSRAVADEKRPDLGQRFPSRDIWEDSPDSLYLETTVSGPQQPEASDIVSPEAAKPAQATFNKPVLPARPERSSKLAEEVKSAQSQPEIPARPAQKSREVPPAGAEAPQIPPRPVVNKPKPQLPSRPLRSAQAGSQDVSSSPLSKTISGGSAEGATAKSPPEVKAKPAVPARPISSNFASLRAGFMNDLNSRLKIGPQAPKKEEEPSDEVKPEEKAPLADARKGRARGPARRKPAAAAAAPAEQDSTSKQSVSMAFSNPSTVWHINEDGHLNVPQGGSSLSTSSGLEQAPASSEVDAIAPIENDDEAELERIISGNTDSAGPTTRIGEDAVFKRPNDHTLDDPVGAEGDAADSTKISAAALDRQKAIESGLEDALVDSERAGETPVPGATNVAAAVPEFSSEVPVSGGQAAKDAATDEQRTEALSSIPAGGATTTSHAAAETKADAGAGEMIHQSAQTGEKDVSITSPTGEKENLHITIGGRAPEEGDVITKADGEEIVKE